MFKTAIISNSAWRLLRTSITIIHSDDGDCCLLKSGLIFSLYIAKYAKGTKKCYFRIKTFPYMETFFVSLHSILNDKYKLLTALSKKRRKHRLAKFNMPSK